MFYPEDPKPEPLAVISSTEALTTISYLITTILDAYPRNRVGWYVGTVIEESTRRAVLVFSSQKQRREVL